MKLTKLFLALVWGSVILARSVDAVTFTPTPTLVPIKLVKLQPTIKLVVLPTKAVTMTATPTAKISITPTGEPSPTITETPTEIIQPSATVTPVKDTSSDDLSKWFLVATVALLTLVIVVQAWPERKNREE